MPLNLEVYDEDRNSRNDFIGSVQLSLGELQRLSESHSPVILKKGPKERGQLLVTECQIEEPSSDLERKGSIGAYPSSRRQSTYSSPGDLATSQVYQQQAVAPQLLGQGQPCHPLHAAPQLLGQGHPHHHPGQYQGGPYGDHNVNSFPPGPPFVFPFNQTGPGPYTPGPYVPFPGTGPYVPTPGYPAPTAFPPTIPEDPSDTRPKSIWL